MVRNYIHTRNKVLRPSLEPLFTPFLIHCMQFSIVSLSHLKGKVRLENSCSFIVTALCHSDDFTLDRVFVHLLQYYKESMYYCAEEKLQPTVKVSMKIF